MRKISAKFFFVIAIFVISGTGFKVNSQIPDYDSLPKVGLPEVEISAMRLPFKESSVPFSISLLDIRENTMGLSLAENLASLPGLQVNARYNYAVGDRITNRGFGARTQFGVRGIKIVFDDVPVTFADGQTNLEMIDLQNLSYVEFLRGPGSSLYGNSSGGVLLIHSRDISENTFRSSVSSAIGSNGLFRWVGSVEGRKGKTAMAANYTEFHYNGFRDHASANYNRVFIKSVTDLSQKDKLQIEAGYVKFNALNPGSLTKAESVSDPTAANPASVANAASQDGNQVQLSGSWKHRTGKSGLNITMFGIHRSVVNPIIGKIIVLPQYSGGLVASFNSESSFLGKSVQWSAGSETALRFNNRKNYTNNNGVEGIISINQKEQVAGSGLFLQAHYPEAAKVSLDVCLRYDLNYFGVSNMMPAVENASGNRLMKSFNPSIGIIYHLFKDTRFFANISTSFETPTSTELVNRPGGAGGFNPDLNPAHAIEYETGLRGYLNPGITYDVAAYFIRTKNELIPFQVETAPGQDYFRNAGSTIRRGGEATLRFSPVAVMDLISTLTYIDACYKKFTVKGSDFTGNLIPGINHFHWDTELKCHNSKGFCFSIKMENYGKMYVDDANSESTKTYTLVDLIVGHDGLTLGKNWKKSFIFSGGISNLFNRKFITAVTVNASANRYFEPGPGRTIYVNLRFEIGKK